MTVFEKVDEGAPCIEVVTSAGCYRYQSEAGGFSSIIDPDGIDWVDFHPGKPEAPGGAAGVFRGLPNLVFPDNIGHPGYRYCRSRYESRDGATVIETASLDGDWEWMVTVRDAVCAIDVVRAPAARGYWFLYEGVPAGRFDPAATVWGTPRGRYDGRAGEERFPSRPSSLGAAEWIYFGAEGGDRVFFCAHGSDEGSREESTLFFMEAEQSGATRPAGRRPGMVVFGFGRTPKTKPLLTGRHRFLFGFIESGDHEEIAGSIRGRLSGNRPT